MHQLLAATAARNSAAAPSWTLGEHCLLSSAGRGSLPHWQYRERPAGPAGAAREKEREEEMEKEREKEKEKERRAEDAAVAVKAITSKLSAGAWLETQAEQLLPPSSPVQQRTEAPSAEQQQGQGQGQSSLSVSLVPAPAPVITQALDGDTLCVTCVFPAPGAGGGSAGKEVQLRNISALVDTAGRTLLLEDGTAGLIVPIALVRPVQPTTVSAKISTKHRRFSISARVAC